MLKDRTSSQGSAWISSIPSSLTRWGHGVGREAVNEPSSWVSWPPAQGIDSRGRNRAPAWHRQQSGEMGAGARQVFKTKSGFELGLKSCSKQDPNSNLGPRQNLGFEPDLNSGCRSELNTQATRGQARNQACKEMQTQGATRCQAAGVSRGKEG